MRTIAPRPGRVRRRAPAPCPQSRSCSRKAIGPVSPRAPSDRLPPSQRRLLDEDHSRLRIIYVPHTASVHERRKGQKRQNGAPRERAASSGGGGIRTRVRERAV